MPEFHNPAGPRPKKYAVNNGSSDPMYMNCEDSLQTGVPVWIYVGPGDDYDYEPYPDGTYTVESQEVTVSDGNITAIL